MKGVLLKDLYIAGSNVVVTVIMLAVLGFGLSFLMEPSAILILAPGITTIPAFISITSSGSVTTKYDCTKPGVDGTEITDVLLNGVMVSGYCRDNIIDQHLDDEAWRSVNNPNCTSGIRALMLYKVKNGVRTSIRTDRTQKSFSYSDTHSYFDLYYDINVNEPDEAYDYYLIVVEDYAGNITTKKLTSQMGVLKRYHTSIDRNSYSKNWN